MVKYILLLLVRSGTFDSVFVTFHFRVVFSFLFCFFGFNAFVSVKEKKNEKKIYQKQIKKRIVKYHLGFFVSFLSIRMETDRNLDAVISGTSIDQGIAYVLMLAALVLTYLIHPLDASSYNFF